LNGLKQIKFKSCNGCELWKGKVIISKPKDCAYYIDSKVIWDPCSSRINKWWLVVEIPFGTYQLKKEKNSLKKNMSSMFFLVFPCMYLFCKIWYNHFSISHLWKWKSWQLIIPEIWEWCCKHGLNPF
jgi:hypothetical protein